MSFWLALEAAASQAFWLTLEAAASGVQHALTPTPPAPTMSTTDGPGALVAKLPSRAAGDSASAAEHARLHVSTRGDAFVDSAGRVLSLRGVNLGGSSKMPVGPTGPTHIRDGFFEDTKSISFVGRPFPLEEADEHFNRMRAWGFNLIRLIITWEAVEHAGPGEYDAAYLAYIAELIERARQFSLAVYIDPHQVACLLPLLASFGGL